MPVIESPIEPEQGRIIEETPESILAEPVVPDTEIEPTPEATVEEGEEEQAGPTGPVTLDSEMRRARSESVIPSRGTLHGSADRTGPSWVSSAAWAQNDYGVVGNTSRWVQQATDEPDEHGTKDIFDNFEALSYGVSEEHHDYIAGLGSLASAERESDRLRVQTYRDAMRENESFGQALTAGVVGFVIDPVNLIPGAMIFKGMGPAAKMTATLGLRGAATTQVGKRAALWGAAGFTEEAIRTVPRLMSDQTYQMDGYLTDAAMGLAFGAAGPVIGAGYRTATGGMGNAVGELARQAEAYGIDSAFRRAGHTASIVAEQVELADGGIIAKFREIDLGAAAREAKVKVARIVEDQVRELRETNVGQTIADAIDAADPEALLAVNKGWLSDLGAAIQTRTSNAWKEYSPGIKNLGERIKAAASETETPIVALAPNERSLTEEIGQNGSTQTLYDAAKDGVKRNDAGVRHTANRLAQSEHMPAIEARLKELGLDGLTRLGGGVQRVVFSVPGRTDIVIRIGDASASNRYYNHPLVIKPLFREQFGTVAVEILPRVRAKLKPKALRELRELAKKEGLVWTDDWTFNAGTLPNGQPVIIDGPVRDVMDKKKGAVELVNRMKAGEDIAGINDATLNMVTDFDDFSKIPEGGVPGQASFDAKSVEEGLNAGAAQRRTTAADRVGDAVEDVRAVARDAKRTMQEATDTAQKMLDEADLSDDARRNLQFFIDRMRNQNEEAIDIALKKRGLRPIRKTLNNKDHTEATRQAVDNVTNASNTLWKRVGQSIADKLPEGFDMGKRGNHAMKNAFHQAGINRMAADPNYPTGKKETLSEAFARTAKGMSHVQRRVLIQKLSDAVANNIENMKHELDTNPHLGAKERTQLAKEIDETATEIMNQMELANVIGRNPFEDATIVKAQWAQISDAWREKGNMAELEKQFVDSKTQAAVKHQYGQLTESLSSRLIKSGAPVAQWFTHHVLETPSGFGGKLDRAPLTAAIYAETLDAQARRPVLNAWEAMMKERATSENWPWLKRVFNKQGNSKTHSDVTKISKEVQLEMNARHFGTTSSASPEVRKFADVLEDSYSALHDLQNGHVQGIHDGNKIKGYQHQAWDDGKIMDLIENDVGRKGITDLFRTGYLNAGMDIDKATILAKAMVDQKVASAARPKGSEMNFGDEQLKGMMPELTEVVDRMRKNGTSEEVITEIVDHINKAAKGDTPGYAKNRVPIDLNASAVINGQTIKVVDIMDNDVPGIFTTYSKESTARRAISESTGGVLNGDRAIHDMLVAMKMEAIELGANVDTRAARNAIQMMMGRQYDGQLPMDVRRARDAVALAGMGGLGESQLAEFGLAVNRGMAGMIGAMQKFRVAGANVNRKWRGIELTPEQSSDKMFLSELQEASGLYGDMHLIDRRNVHFDAKEAEMKGLSSVVDTMTGGKFRPLLQHMQTKYTGYGVLRQFEDQIAMASLMQDLSKRFGGRKAYSTDDRLKDLGVDVADDGWLAKRFKDTVNYKDDGTIEQLNLNQWSELDRNRLGVILNRYSSQQVQKGFVGESSPEMMNPWVSFLMQFKSYPMIAAEKQQARHLKFADKEAAVGTLLNAASSGAARAIRYHSLAQSLPEEDREAYLNRKFSQDFATDTLAYMGGAGMMVDNFTTARDIYTGKESVADQLPVLNYIDNYMSAMKGPLDLNIDDRDSRNMQVAAPLGTIAQSNFVLGIIRNLMGDEE